MASVSASEASELLDIAVQGARAAAAIVRARAREAATISWRLKRPADFVTEVDTDAEAQVREVVARRAPEAVVAGEELSPEMRLDQDLVFVVDPLDGTTNFLHGYPAYAVSIAALRAGDAVAGVVLDAASGECFTATRGGGARRDGEPLRVSAVAQPSRALIGTGFPFKYPEQLETYQRQFARVLRGSADIRRAGSAALDLAAVACGRLDGFWELRLAPWDIAAGVLLIREAGGRATDLDGTPIVAAHTAVVAGNAPVHSWLLSTLRREERRAERRSRGAGARGRPSAPP